MFAEALRINFCLFVVLNRNVEQMEIETRSLRGSKIMMIRQRPDFLLEES